jgi:hypothetical protein
MKSLLAALASAGIAVAQQVGEVVDAGEQGKQSRRCVIIEAKTNPDGSSDYTLQEVATKQLFKLHKPGENGQPASSTQPPPSTTLPPAPPPQPAPSTLPTLPATTVNPVPAPSAAAAHEQVMIIHEEGQNPGKARILQSWTTEAGQKVYLAEYVESKQKVTVVQEKKGDSEKSAISCRFYHWKSDAHSPTGAPLPPTMEAAKAEPKRELPKVESKHETSKSESVVVVPESQWTADPRNSKGGKTTIAEATPRSDKPWGPAPSAPERPWATVAKADTTAAAPLVVTPPPPAKSSNGSGSSNAQPSGNSADSTMRLPGPDSTQHDSGMSLPIDDTGWKSPSKGQERPVPQQPVYPSPVMVPGTADSTQPKGSSTDGPSLTQAKGSSSASQSTNQSKGSSSAAQTTADSKGSGLPPWARIGDPPSGTGLDKGSGATAADVRPDPLLKPEEYNWRDVEKRLGMKGSGSGSGSAPKGSAAPAANTTQVVNNVTLPPDLGGQTTARKGNDVPVNPGAADNRSSQSIPGAQYVPITPNTTPLPPIRQTVPTQAVGQQPMMPNPSTPLPPPVPPPAPVDTQNAFTRNLPAPKAQMDSNGAPMNAFANPQQMQQQQMQQQQMSGMYPMGMQRPMMPQPMGYYGSPYYPQMGGMPPSMVPAVPYNGTAAPAWMTQQQMIQASYYQQPRPQMPMAGGMGMPMFTPYAPPLVPSSPAVPTAAPQQPSGGAPGVAQAISVNAPSNETAIPSRDGMTVAQMTRQLQEAMYPSHREWAADQLGSVDARNNPQVISALMLAASEDPSAGVRATAVHSLCRLNANDLAVVRMLQGMRSDTDPMVHSEVEKALSKLAPNGVGADVVPVKADQK